MLTVEYEGLLDYIEKPFTWIGEKISSLFHSSPVRSASVNTSMNPSLQESFAKYVGMPNLAQSQSTSLRDTFAKYVNLPSLSRLPSKTTTNIPTIHTNSSSLSSQFLDTIKDILTQTGKVIISTATQAAANALSYKIQKALGVPVTISGNSIHVYHPIQPQPSYTPRPQPQPSYTPRPQPQPRYTPRPQPQPRYTPRPQPQPRYTPRPQPQPKVSANAQIDKNLLILGGALLLVLALSRR